MSRLSAELRQRRGEVRRALSQAQQQARERAGRNPVLQRAREQRRRRRQLALAVILVLLALLSQCECERPGPAVPKTVEPEAPVILVPPPKPPAPKPAKVKRPPLRAASEQVQRGSLDTQARGAPPWLEEFRMQVSARSPRLARCFNGAERPGALRWTVSLNPMSGTASEHEFEPVGQGAEISREQQRCLVLALSSPVYRVAGRRGEALLERLSLVIEF